MSVGTARETKGNRVLLEIFLCATMGEGKLKSA